MENQIIKVSCIFIIYLKGSKDYMILDKRDEGLTEIGSCNVDFSEKDFSNWGYVRKVLLIWGGSNWIPTQSLSKARELHRWIKIDNSITVKENIRWIAVY